MLFELLLTITTIAHLTHYRLRNLYSWNSSINNQRSCRRVW
jgi:hypothetical protein